MKINFKKEIREFFEGIAALWQVIFGFIFLSLIIFVIILFVKQIWLFLT